MLKRTCISFFGKKQTRQAALATVLLKNGQADKAIEVVGDIKDYLRKKRKSVNNNALIPGYGYSSAPRGMRWCKGELIPRHS